MAVVSYPMFDLSTIVGIIKKTRKAGKNINKQLFANASTNSNNASTTSGIFNQKLSALKHYNLARVDNSNIIFTNLADKILNNSLEAKRMAFLAPSTFKQMYSSLEKNTALETNLMEDIAHLKIGISEAGKRRFVRNFIESGIYVELIEYSLESRNKYIILEKNSTNNKEIKLVKKQINRPSSQEARLKLSCGEAFILVPEKLEKTDKEKLKSQIDIF